jgi:linoleoyl-CoA desaturase
LNRRSRCFAALWRSAGPSPRETRSDGRRLDAKVLCIAGLVPASHVVLVVFTDAGLPVQLVAAAVLITGVGTCRNHANHGSFSRHRSVRRVLTCTSDALGASSWLSRVQHGDPNVVGFQADIELFPFARLAPAQP